MRPHFFSILRHVAAGALAGLLIIATAAGQAERPVTEILPEAIQLYLDAEFDKGLAVAQGLLGRKDLNAKDSVAIYAAMSILTFGKGELHFTDAFKLLDRIATVGPCTVQLPYDFWPPEIRDQWFRILKAKNALSCTSDAAPGIKTIAIMEFDNYSTGKYQEELGFVTKGLADFFESDFAKISTLRVVERDKIDFVLKEIQMAQSGAVSPSTAVQVGKLLGAQIMVFGTVVQLDDKQAKMLVKAVKVETSEIIASVEKEGKPDFFKMQKEMVPELAKKLDLKINPEAKVLIDESGSTAPDAAMLYSKGLYFMDKYDYKQAYQFFKDAFDKDNTFAEAKRKMEILWPLVAS